MDKKNSKVLVTVLTILLSIGAGFGGGYFFRNHQLSRLRGNFAGGGLNGAQRFTGGTRPSGMGGSRNFGGVVMGSILSMDEKSITVSLMDGSSKIILFSDSTTYSNSVASTKSDLKVGGEVSVFGMPNSDGSITANSVQLNPVMFRSQVSPSPQKN